MKRVVCFLAALCVAAPVIAQTTAAPPVVGARSFGWFAEFVSFDAKGNVVTVKARIEPHVARYISTFAPADRIVLTWSQFGGNADAITYVASEKAMTAKSGYLLRGRFVSADPSARTVTIAVPVPAAVSSMLVAAKSGTPIRVDSPMAQPGPEAILTSVALNKTAPPRPAPAPKAAARDEKVADVAGNWVVDTNVMGNAVTLRCNVTQSGKTLGGTCQGPGPLASLPVSGSARDEENVVLSFDVSQGVTITLRHTGTLSRDGKTIEGQLELNGISTPFKATKQ